MAGSARDLHAKLDSLVAVVAKEGEQRFEGWSGRIGRREFQPSARNLAHYLALRRHDIRNLQRPLTSLGLSSLGRLESRVMPTLLATRAALACIAGLEAEPFPDQREFFAGEALLARRSKELFGAAEDGGVALMVTCPTEAADDRSFMASLIARGVEAIRINCAHDDAAAWERMIGMARASAKAAGKSIKVTMDLAGPKLRTQDVRCLTDKSRACEGDAIAIAIPGKSAEGLAQEASFVVSCAAPEPVAALEVGHRVFIDDGKIEAQVEQVVPWGALTRIVAAEAEGVKLKPEKGINFPDTDYVLDALTEKDRDDLDFVAAHADAINYSFVQSAADVELLQAALAERRPKDWRKLALILKVETARAVHNLPDMLIQAAGQQPAAIMIARGDLAVELGFTRMAEMQEEILWLGEAAHTPVIWATQVLEHFVKKGTPSRGEMTDAAMAARAECVMLNKGPHLLAAIDQLRILLQRMGEHQHKKTPRLRRLKSW